MDVHDRLKLLWKDTGDSGAKFDSNCGLSHGYITKCISKKWDITVSTFNKIFGYYVEYSPCFVIFGQGKLKTNDNILNEKSNLLHSLPAIVVTNKAGKITYVNEDYELQTGFTLKELKGKKPGYFLKRKDFSEKTKLRIKASKKQAEYLEILPTYTKLGFPVFCQIKIIPLKNGYIGFCNFLALKE